MKLLLIIALLFTFQCKKEKKESLTDTLTKFSLLSLLSTAGRCDFTSANNPSYFTSNTTPTGGTTPVSRISTIKDNQYFDIYYPNTTNNLPVLVLFQGGNVHSSFYSKYAARIASEGYVVYVGSRCTTFIIQYFIYPSGALGNKTLALAKEQNSDSTSPLFGRIDTSKVGFLGHSLGGVIGIFAMNGICEFPFCDTNSGYSFLSEVKGGVFYGTALNANFDPAKFKIQSSTNKGIPLGYIQGTLDGANKPETGRASYDRSIATKVYFTVDGSNHYGVTDLDNPFGANKEVNSPTLSQDTAIQKISEASILFLNVYIKGTGAITNGSSGITGVTVEISP